MYKKKAFEDLGVSIGVAETALELTLKHILCGWFDLHECDISVDIKSKTAMFSFGVPKKIALKEASVIDPNIYFCDSLPVTLDFSSFPKPLVKECKALFPRFLDEIRALNAYELWKSCVHKAVEGVIVDIGEDKSWIKVDLSNQIGIMEKEEWTPRESHLYRKGRVFFFYVMRTTLKKGVVEVFLSRNSLNLPAVLLKQRVPWIKFICEKRYVGHKSWVRASSTDQVVKNAVKDIQQELSNERIEIRHL